MRNTKNPMHKKIKMAMLESGLNQTQLAKQIGISRQSLSEWLSQCENPKIENIKKIAKATGKPINYFFENSGNFADNNSTINASSDTENLRIALVEKDVELLKKEVEIIKLKLEKGVK